ncbi:MAG TPA: carbamoyltransferase C-terminal domain-containing protein [Bryobacteraceae bacterium]|nr:carbamoyltransferase C-terminal domain-containing protein [Bryobacteraceae bacterium]
MSTVIGIHDGHNASVAVVRDGRLELALQEERLTRVKNQGDLPRLAARAALDLVNGGAASVRVALNGRYMHYGQWSREAVLGDYERSSALASRAQQPFKGTFLDRLYQARRERGREREVATLGFRREQIEPVEHHLAHASAAYYTCPWPGEKVLVLTCDGSGDRLAATVSIGERGRLTRIAEVNEQDSIGRLYAVITRLLGMAPLEHEYKVMGLAPYVSDPLRADSAARPFLDLFAFTRNPLVWRRRPGVPSMYSSYRFFGRLIAGQRFDTIAAGAQRFIEKMLAAWVRNAVRETGIRRIACSGGVFMNVKANLAVLELDEVDELYVFPSCGDESNSIGAACCRAAHAGDRIEPLGALYFGTAISDAEADQALSEAGRSQRLKTRYVADIEAWTAGQVAAGKIVARAKGPMEFGARALGNRSILARADSPVAVRVINGMIKNRDFWMPFAPSVVSERAADYYDKPKPVASPYMMLAFRSRERTRARFCAAQHPCDFTARPQEVVASHNPDYYRLLKHYEERTGEGIVLNTSFNLHGEPIVYGARDAVGVFVRSGLRAMALGNWWVEKP